jgi:diguanylate cyclase (GGDEF)-like protein
VVNVEIGRLLEGGRSDHHRPHKALSAWAFCSVLLLPMPYVLLVVAFSHAHVRWRGLRLPLWKWVGSASFVVLAGLAAGATARALHGSDPNWMAGEGGRGLLATCTGAAVFLAVETALFHGSAYLNRAEDEAWLRRTLRGRSFYVTEGGVLLMGALSAAVWTAGAWFLLLLVPVYATAQRAALHEPLRERAETDDKTGLLRFESWRQLAVAEQARCAAKGRPWSVAFADLDHFKRYNDEFGHLVGDSALGAVAEVLRAQLRSRDLVGRFGGEEFCVFLPDTPAAEARAVAERLCRAVAERDLPGSGTRTTVSVGVATFAAGVEVTQFVDALTVADRALFEAKVAGRNRVVAREVAAGEVDWLEARPAPVRE